MRRYFSVIIDIIHGVLWSFDSHSWFKNDIGLVVRSLLEKTGNPEEPVRRSNHLDMTKSVEIDVKPQTNK